MLNGQTLEQLQALRLPALAAAWTAQQPNAERTAPSGFDERFALLVDAEWRARENKRLTRTLRKPSRDSARPASRPSTTRPGANSTRRSSGSLATCRWVGWSTEQVLISGMTGVGKSFLACALATQACRKGYRARYWRTSHLYHACTLARAGRHLHPVPRPTRPSRRIGPR